MEYHFQVWVVAIVLSEVCRRRCPVELDIFQSKVGCLVWFFRAEVKRDRSAASLVNPCLPVDSHENIVDLLGTETTYLVFNKEFPCLSELICGDASQAVLTYVKTEEIFHLSCTDYLFHIVNKLEALLIWYLAERVVRIVSEEDWV